MMSLLVDFHEPPGSAMNEFIDPLSWRTTPLVSCSLFLRSHGSIDSASR